MASSTYNTILKWGATVGALTKKVDIKDYPDLIGEPNMLETTTLSDSQQTFIPGLKQSDTKAFTCNYDKTVFASCKADESKPLYFALEFEDGTSFSWQGEYTLGVPGKGADEVKEFTINIAASTDVEWTDAP